MILIITVLLFLSQEAQPRILVDNGIIKITDNKNCNVTVNNSLYFNKTGQLPGLHYGYITYECGHEIGNIISELKCKDCGLFCIYNELIDGCQQYWTTFMLGLITSLLIILIILILFKTLITSHIKLWIDYLISKIYVCKDNRKVKTLYKISKHSNADFKVKYTDPLPITQKYVNKIKDNRIRLSYKLASEQPIEQEVNEGGKENKAKMSLRTETYPAIKLNSLIGVLSIITIFNLVEVQACDNTLFINAIGKVCNNNFCKDINMFDISLMSGSTICFKDTKNNLMELRMIDSYYRNIYALLYYTQSFELDYIHYWRCTGAGGCWIDKCDSNSSHESLKSSLPNSTIFGYGCGSDVLGCNGGCFYQTTCVWYKWGITPKGELTPVYSRQYSIWEVKFSVKYKDVEKIYTINANNPKVNLDTMDSILPIHASGFISELPNIANGIILLNNTAYEIETAQMNMPNPHLIGDYQVSLDKKTHSYPENEINCQTSSCKVKCHTSESMLSRFNRRLSSKNTVDYHHEINLHRLETKLTVGSVFRFMIGDVDIKSLFVKQAICKFDIITAFACKGCSLRSFAMIQPHSIKSQGLVKFSSNCSFTTMYISCNPEPYKLELYNPEETCQLDIDNSNQSLTINFALKFLGSLDESKKMWGVETTGELIKGVVTSEGFVTGLMSTFSFISISGLLTNIIIRFIKLIQLKYAIKQQEDNFKV